MSIYDNDTSKMYPTLDPSAPPSQEVNPPTYRLAKISEIEAYFLDEIDTREKLAKKIKRFSTITAVLDTSLITTTAITGGISIFFFFFYLGFLSRTFTIHGTAGEGGGYLFNSSLPLPPA